MSAEYLSCQREKKTTTTREEEFSFSFQHLTRWLTMDVNTEQKNTWISLGVIAGLAVVLALFRTWKWFGRSAKNVIDLPVKQRWSNVFLHFRRSVVLDDRQIRFQYDRFNWNRFTSRRQWRFGLLAFAIQSFSIFVFHFESFSNRFVSFRKRSTMKKKIQQVFPKR